VDVHGETSEPAILFVDDAVDGRQMYAEFFQTLGFRMLQAGTALDGYRLAVGLRPAAAVVDLYSELVRKLKSTDTTARLPVVPP
jgi:DNA-binding response OmpR family regulator